MPALVAATAHKEVVSACWTPCGGWWGWLSSGLVSETFMEKPVFFFKACFEGWVQCGRSMGLMGLAG